MSDGGNIRGNEIFRGMAKTLSGQTSKLNCCSCYLLNRKKLSRRFRRSKFLSYQILKSLWRFMLHPPMEWTSLNVCKRVVDIHKGKWVYIHVCVCVCVCVCVQVSVQQGTECSALFLSRPTSHTVAQWMISTKYLLKEFNRVLTQYST